MSKPKKHKVNWGAKLLEIENLNVKSDPHHFDRLVEYVIAELKRKVISEKELMLISSTKEIRHFVWEAVTKYNAEKHGNVGFYAYQRLKFLVLKWKARSDQVSDN